LTTENKSEASQKPLHGMFTDIPPRYDLINHLITWGMDKGWRNQAVKACLKNRPQKFLDLCCGTGDLAIMVARKAEYPIEVTGLDYSHPMLKIAERKAKERTHRKIHFIPGEAAKLPFKNNEMDGIGISFAFRNLTYKNPLAQKHISEIVRVLRPGGKFVIAESSQPKNGFIRACNHFYMRGYVYHIGAWLSGNKPAYKYLAESTCNYFSPKEMEKFLLKNGFKEVKYKALFFGAAGIYTATK